MQIKAKEYWRLFKPSACSIGLKAASKEEVFGEIVENFVRAKMLVEDFRDAALASLIRREGVASTGVGGNVAVPHVQLKGLEEAIVSLSIHRNGVEWSSLDGEPVHILFAVMRPEQGSARWDPERHLEMMRWISQLSREADFRRFAMGVSNRTELVDLLKEMSGT